MPATQESDKDALAAALKELSVQAEQSRRLAAELLVARAEVAFQKDERRKRATERATELGIANKELVFQDDEKGKRAAELAIADKELAFQDREKGKRAAELIVANTELVFQNKEKEKKAAELIVANKELVYQNKEKERRAAELIIANKELAIENEEKEKRAAKLTIANKELEQFAYVASHDLQEPLRTVSNYMQVFEKDYSRLLDDNARGYLRSVNNATKRMSILVKSLLNFSRLGRDKTLTNVDCGKIVHDVISDLHTVIKTANADVEAAELPKLNAYGTELSQVFLNLITNAIKFQKKGVRPIIKIRAQKMNEQWEFSVADNGIGIAAALYVFSDFGNIIGLN